MQGAGWERGFVAASLALGATLDEALARLAPSPRASAGALVVGLRAETRPARAAALAAALAEIALDAEARRP